MLTSFIISQIILVALSIAKIGDGYRILGLAPYNGRSHFIMLEPLFKELARRGHEVDVLSHFPQKEKIPGYNDLSIAGSLPVVVGSFRFDKMGDKNFPRWFHMVLTDFGLNLCKNAFNTTVAKDLRDSKRSYDLIITEIFFTDCMYAFAHHFKAPVLAITTCTDYPWGGSRLGNPITPSYIPVHFLPYVGKMNLIERVWNTIYYIGTSIYYEIYSARRGTEMARAFVGEDMPHLSELIYNYTSLILINTHFSINNVAPKTPNFIEVAGLHIPPAKPLPQHIEKELEIGDQYKGVIYMSFGSLIAVESLPWYVLNSFCEAFSQLKSYKILWKATYEKFPKNLTIPNNIHFEKWMPQRDILCHPNVKLFISHGGLMGTQEGIYCGVPTLGLPIFADQNFNIENLKSRGLSVRLDYADVSNETVINALTELLENPKYKNNAETISTLFRDRPHSALDTAVYWTEYVLRYGGAQHLKCDAAELPWYQYFLLDVIAILITILGSVLFIICYLISLCCSLMRKKRSTKIKIQ